MPLPDDVVVHRVGGSELANLRLKPLETVLVVPGFSVLAGGTPTESAAQLTAMRRRPSAAWRAIANVVSTASVGDVRAAGFDVILVPSDALPNHARVVHPLGVAGFDDTNLNRLRGVFRETVGCMP